MLKPFWNKKCETFSEDLWKPDNKDLKKSKKDTPYWNCDNKNISFTHYLPKKEIDNKIDFDFKPVPTINESIRIGPISFFLK